MVWHPLAALAKVPGLTEILIIGFYEDSVMSGFIKDAKREFPNIGISYLREYKPLGTAGGLYHCEWGRDWVLGAAPLEDSGRAFVHLGMSRQRARSLGAMRLAQLVQASQPRR
jgi:hypothetical protein